MKKLCKKLCIVILFTLLLLGCQRKEADVKSDLISNDTTSVTKNEDYPTPVTNNSEYISSVNNNDYSDILNDLLYRDYGTGIKLSGNSKLVISQLDLGLKDETAIIYAINLENGEAIKLYDYKAKHDIYFTPASDGVYMIVAKLSNGEIIDLTPKAMVEGINSVESGSELIPLK
ncbi:MAG: hypothetical protein GX757_13315 [Clostridiales bacterium]|nr:hypothetical protein [Clostridiales bacterium]